MITGGGYGAVHQMLQFPTTDAPTLLCTLLYNASGIRVRFPSDSELPQGGRAANNAGNLQPKDGWRRSSRPLEVEASRRNRKRTALDLEGEGRNGKNKEWELPAISNRVRKKVLARKRKFVQETANDWTSVQGTGRERNTRKVLAWGGN